MSLSKYNFTGLERENWREAEHDAHTHIWMWLLFHSDFSLTASGQVYCLAANPQVSASGLISCSPLSISVKACCFLHVLHCRHSAGIPDFLFFFSSMSASMVGLGGELSLFQCILLSSNSPLDNWSARLKLKCQGVYLKRRCE